jgi:hypothetical protein
MQLQPRDVTLSIIMVLICSFILNIRDLFHGRLGYTLAATFETPTIVPILLSINPRIDIFVKTEKSSLNFEAAGE